MADNDKPDKPPKIPWHLTDKGRATRARIQRRANARRPDINRRYVKRRSKLFHKVSYLNMYHNRFLRMAKKDISLKNMNDLGLRHFEAILKDPNASPERKDNAAAKILPYTSQALATNVNHSGTVTHTASDVDSKIDQLLFDKRDVVQVKDITPKAIDVDNDE